MKVITMATDHFEHKFAQTVDPVFYLSTLFIEERKHEVKEWSIDSHLSQHIAEALRRELSDKAIFVL